MSITKMKIPAIPMAVGFVLTGVLQSAAYAQDAELEDAPPPQVGGVMAFGGGEMPAPSFDTAILTPALGEAFVVGAAEEGGHHHHHGFSEANKMTDDQYEKIYAIKGDMKDQMGLKMAQCHILQRKLKDTLAAASIDTKAAQDIAGKITALKADMTQLKLDSMIKIAQVFTPEQRKELHLMMIKGHMHHHHGFHHHWGHGPQHFPGASHEHHGELGK